MTKEIDLVMEKANDLANAGVTLRDELRRFQKEFHPDEERLYQIQFPYFYRNMLREMDRHYPEKGDSYHEASVEEMEAVLTNVLEIYWSLDWDHARKASQLIDVANVCAMLYQRLQGI